MSFSNRDSEGKASRWLGPVLLFLYRVIRMRGGRAFIRRLIMLLEGGLEGAPLHSRTLRRLFRDHHGVEVGLYSWSGCFVVGNFRAGTKIGRFAEIAATATAPGPEGAIGNDAAHDVANRARGRGRDTMKAPADSLEIGSDVWLGHNSVLLPSVQRIGIGAVIGAGAVVHKDVPPYAVVVGNPGRVVRYRFGNEVIRALLASHWWEKSIAELSSNLPYFQRPLDA